MPDPVDTEKIFNDFGALFGDLFGADRATADVRRTLRLTLAEAAHGADKTIEEPRKIPCEACEGRGGAPNATKHVCAACEGRGQAVHAQGFFQVATTCKDCKGVGQRWDDPCPLCRGAGTTDRPGRWTVSVPPGIAAGQTLRLAGQGNDLGEGPGDAYFEIVIDPHPVLRRRGDDLLARVRIEDALAEAGGELRVPWLDGDAVVRVPEAARHGAQVTLKGWGAVKLGSKYAPPPEPSSPYRSGSTPARGDLIVTLLTEDDAADDPHEVLGVARGASLEQIQAAYRRLALDHHPDRHPDDPDAVDRFEAISRAYATLVDAQPSAAPPTAAPVKTEARWIALALAIVAIGAAALMLMR